MKFSLHRSSSTLHLGVYRWMLSIHYRDSKSKQLGFDERALLA
jgi:hypothetical protein